MTPYLKNSASSSPGIMRNTLFCSPQVRLVWKPTRLYAVLSAFSALSWTAPRATGPSWGR